MLQVECCFDIDAVFGNSVERSSNKLLSKYRLVSWSLTSLFSTNTAISQPRRSTQVDCRKSPTSSYGTFILDLSIRQSHDYAAGDVEIRRGTWKSLGLKCVQKIERCTDPTEKCINVFEARQCLSTDCTDCASCVT